MTNKLSPHFLYGTIGIILLFLSLFSSEALDIAVHDTYIVIEHRLIFIAIASTYFIFALVAWLFQKLNRAFNRTLFLIHIWVTTIGVIMGFLVDYFALTFVSKMTADDYYNFENSENTTNLEDYNTWVEITMIVVVVGQLVLIANVVRSLIAKKGND